MGINLNYDNVKIKEKKVVVKLHEKDGTFKKSIIIPTMRYPVPDEKTFGVFNSENCKKIDDEKVLDVLDTIPYNMGQCYSNAQALMNALQSAGYDAKQYCGWLFIGESIPVFHSWVVLGESVLDLADDMTLLYGVNSKVWESVDTYGGHAELMADFYKTIKEKKVPNRVRMAVVGVPTSGILYVGSECDAYAGKLMYNNLVSMFPDHEACKYKSGERSIIQSMVAEKMEK